MPMRSALAREVLRIAGVPVMSEDELAIAAIRGIERMISHDYAREREAREWIDHGGEA
jgi:hypothetical protein